MAREVRQERRQICVKGYSGAMVNGEQVKNKITSKYPFPPASPQMPVNRDCRFSDRKHSREDENFTGVTSWQQYEAKDIEKKSFLPVSRTREMEAMIQHHYLKER